MSDYTKTNLNEIEDQAPSIGAGDRLEARFAVAALGATDTGLAHHRVKPGQRAVGHRHDQAEEVYVVIGGSGRAKLDDEIVDLARLDALRVAPEVTRAFEAGPEGMELLAFGPRHEGDGELVQDFWTD